MIDPQIVEEVKSRADIVDVIGQYVPLKRAGTKWMGLCPFHKEKSPSFNVDAERGMFYCFGCHKGGDLITFVREHESMEFEDAVRLIARHAGVHVPDYVPAGVGEAGAAEMRRASSVKTRLYELHDKVAAFYQKALRTPAGRPALDYLTKRGLTDDDLVRFGLGYAPDAFDALRTWGHSAGFTPGEMVLGGVLTKKAPEDDDRKAYDRWRHRVMFPIWNDTGRIIGFSGRVLDKEQFGGKYVNSPETPVFHKSDVLYGLPLARSSFKDFGAALICEGQMDTIACHRAGLTHAIAPQGTAFTEGQARKLKRYTDHLIFAFDADNAGVNAALKAAEVFLPVGLTARIVLLGDGEDPDSLLQHHGAAALKARVDAAVDYFQFLLDQLCRRHDPEQPEGKAAIVEAFVALVGKLSSPIMRAEYCLMVEERLRLQRGLASTELQRLGNRDARRAQGQRGYRPDGGPSGAGGANQPPSGGGGWPRSGDGSGGGGGAKGSWRKGGSRQPAGPDPAFANLGINVAPTDFGGAATARPDDRDLRDDDDDDRYQSTAKSAAPVRSSLPLSGPGRARQEAELVLLDLALNNRGYADRLVVDLPHDHISSSPIGEALNQVLAATEQDEWDMAGELLQDSLATYRDPDISRVVFDPHYDSRTEDKICEQAYLDCLQTLSRLRQEMLLEAYTQQLRTAPTREAKREIQLQIQELHKLRASLLRRHSSTDPH